MTGADDDGAGRTCLVQAPLPHPAKPSARHEAHRAKGRRREEELESVDAPGHRFRHELRSEDGERQASGEPRGSDPQRIRKPGETVGPAVDSGGDVGDQPADDEQRQQRR